MESELPSIADVEAVLDQLRAIQDAARDAERGVRAMHKWVKENQTAEEHGEKAGHVRVAVKTLKSWSQPRQKAADVRRVLRWLARSPPGSVSVSEVVVRFSTRPKIPVKTKRAKWTCIRRLVKTFALGQRVSFKLVDGNASTLRGAPAQDVLSRSPPRFQLDPAPPTSYDDLDSEASDGVDLFSDPDEAAEEDADDVVVHRHSRVDTASVIVIDESDDDDEDGQAREPPVIVIDDSDDEGAPDAAVTEALSQYVHVTSNLYDGDARAAAEAAITGEPRRLAPRRQCRPIPECSDDAVEIAHELFATPDKGVGVRTQQFVATGQFAFELVGEVLGRDEFERRFHKAKQGGAANYYFMQLSKQLYLDAQHFGNHARFINHSCEPNCVAQVWTKHGAKRVAIKTIVDMQPRTELTMDYGWFNQTDVNFTCKCGSARCKGVKRIKT